MTDDDRDRDDEWQRRFERFIDITIAVGICLVLACIIIITISEGIRECT